jgi:very-short-patch-repair endonuclease
MTPPELRLWNVLRTGPGGFKYRRQHPVGRYVLDFYCHEARLAVEVDGLSHEFGDRPARDAARDGWLERQGIGVLRISAEAVRTQLDSVVDVITGETAARAPSTASRSPSPRGGGDASSSS